MKQIMKYFLYEGSKTKEISFPLGGIGSGCIGLSGNGRLIDWEIFNRPDKGSDNGYSHFAVKAEKNGEVLDGRVLQGDLLPPYTGSLKGKGLPFGSGPSRGFLAGVPHFHKTRFLGEFPIATLSLEDAAFPGKVTLTAFNPFIPLNDKDSSIPGAFFEIAITNRHKSALTYTVCFTVKNPLKMGEMVNRFHRKRQLSTIQMKSNGVVGNAPEAGDLTIATDAEDISYQEYWNQLTYKGGRRADLNTYWRDFMTPGKFVNRTYKENFEYPGGFAKNNQCLLAAHFEVASGSVGKARFLLTWNFPNCINYWSPACTDTEDECCSESKPVLNTWKNYYATIWKDSFETAQFAFSNWERLYRETASFKDALFSSTLSPAVIDAISANISILKSPTVLRLDDGTFYGWEGCHPETGCCEGSCTHVWNYAYALPFLFPQLERSMREADYRHNLGDDGSMSFRIQLPLGRRRWDFRPCADGQFGGIIKVYRDWKISGDSRWLAGLWPSVKKSLAFAWSPENIDLWDRDKNGVLEGRQHHTLDMELFGPNSWLTGFYLAALKAAAEIAEYLGESVSAREYRSLFEKGKRWVDRHLFNGEYYHQLIDLKDKSILERCAGSAAPDKFLQGLSELSIYWNEYWDEASQQIKFQIAEGCGIDQMVAQWHANICGLGEIFDRNQTKTALKSIYRYNFFKGMREVFNSSRVYSLNDESGVLICTYPRERPTTPVLFAEETMSGFEYQIACHMIQEGLVQEGLEIVKAVRDRYDGEKRNPWNEMECGSNYARSMASYSLLLALSGFEFDMTRGEIGFNPQQNHQHHRYFWCLHTGWGTVEMGANCIKLSILYGEIELKRFKSKMMMNRAVREGNLNGQPLKYKQQEKTLIFTNPIMLKAGSEVCLDLQN